MEVEKLIQVWSTFKKEENDKENNDKHVVGLVVAHFVYLGNNDGKEVNVFFWGVWNRSNLSTFITMYEEVVVNILWYDN